MLYKCLICDALIKFRKVKWRSIKCCTFPINSALIQQTKRKMINKLDSPPRPWLWETEVEGKAVLSELSTRLCLSIHNRFSYLLSVARFPSLLPPQPYFQSFLPLFCSLSCIICVLSCPHFTFPGDNFVCLSQASSLYHLPVLSQNNNSDLSEHFFFVTRGQFSGPGRASAYC